MVRNYETATRSKLIENDKREMEIASQENLGIYATPGNLEIKGHNLGMQMVGSTFLSGKKAQAWDDTTAFVMRTNLHSLLNLFELSGRRNAS